MFRPDVPGFCGQGQGQIEVKGHVLFFVYDYQVFLNNIRRGWHIKIIKIILLLNKFKPDVPEFFGLGQGQI